jgi:putative N6-adenine-specific DNA methylase
LDSLENRVILCNPPYGLRLNDVSSLTPFYKSLGDFLKQRCKGSQAYIFFGDRELIKKIGLRPTWKKPMRNAGLDGRFVRYDLY